MRKLWKSCPVRWTWTTDNCMSGEWIADAGQTHPEWWWLVMMMMMMSVCSPLIRTDVAVVVVSCVLRSGQGQFLRLRIFRDRLSVQIKLRFHTFEFMGIGIIEISKFQAESGSGSLSAFEYEVQIPNTTT